MNLTKRGGVCSSNDYFQAITHFAPGAVLLLTSEGLIRNINPMGCALFEISREKAVGRYLYEICEGKVDIDTQLLLKSFSEGQQKPILVDFTSCDGKQKALSVEMFHCQEFCSDTQCLIATFSNVTCLQKSEEALRRVLADRLRASSQVIFSSDLRYQGVVEASPNWVSLIDTEGRILVINPAGKAILQREKNEITGIHLWEFFASPDRDTLRKDIIETFASNSIFETEAELRINDDPVFLTLICRPVPDSGALLSRAVIIATDITLRKRAELELKKTLDTLEERVVERTRQLETANAELAKEITVRKEYEEKLKKAIEDAKAASLAKSEFLANMSHEIRTPMNSVLGFIDLLLSTSLSEKQRDYAAIVKSSGSLLLALIDDILDLSKIEANKLILDKTPFSFGKMIRDIVKLFEPKAADKGITLHLELDSQLIAHEVNGDSQRVRQVLINLIGNAVKFTKNGYVKIKARQSCNNSGNCYIDVSVEDSGIGISAADLPLIFEKFTKANTGTTRRFGGTGLGLAISKRLVDLMGGTIGCCSTPGKGSEFFFNIPFDQMAAESSNPENNANSNELSGKPEIKPADVSILIVEDDPASCKFAEQCLELFGFRHQSVDNGLKATEILNRTRFDLVILDWCLPGWSGLAITEALRKNQGPNQHVPIIAVTARAMKGDREACLNAGMDAYLSKPFSPEDLLRQTLKLLKLKTQP
ncbi:MAG TPA: ATP-binding protein [Candidatus Ozemobacteraceae bacterium]|nr:ATP-binding protein [Candidatus Ozemobacteraceae bacterium]